MQKEGCLGTSVPCWELSSRSSSQGASPTERRSTLGPVSSRVYGGTRAEQPAPRPREASVAKVFGRVLAVRSETQRGGPQTVSLGSGLRWVPRQAGQA